MVVFDRYILSLKDPLYTSAVTTGGFTALTLSLFFIHLIFFSTTLIGKRYGKGEEKSCHTIVWNCFLVATCAIPALLLLREGGWAYFTFLGHPADYRALENGYFKVLILSQIPVLYRTSLESYFLGVGRSRGILFASLIGLLANIPLTYLFVLGPASHYFEGITGAAWGTFFANLFSLLVLAFLYFKSYRNYPSISWRETYSGADFVPLLKEGSYTGLEKFVNSFCFVSFVNMFVYYGEEVSTAISIVFSWDQIAFLPLMGIYGAVMSLYSRFLGQGDEKGAIRSLHSALGMTTSLMLLFALLFLTSAEALTTAFMGEGKTTMDGAVIRTHAIFFFQTTCFYIFANMAIFLYKAALRSLGFSGWCFRLSLVVHLMLVLSSYCAVYLLDIGPVGVWMLFLGMLTGLSFAFITKFYQVAEKAVEKQSVPALL